MEVKITYKIVQTRFGEAYCANCEEPGAMAASGSSFGDARFKLIKKLREIQREIEDNGGVVIPEGETINL